MNVRTFFAFISIRYRRLICVISVLVITIYMFRKYTHVQLTFHRKYSGVSKLEPQRELERINTTEEPEWSRSVTVTMPRSDTIPRSLTISRSDTMPSPDWLVRRTDRNLWTWTGGNYSHRLVRDMANMKEPPVYLNTTRNPCWWENTQNKAGVPPILRCLPYAFLGLAKCGSTDLYDRLARHPDVAEICDKEPLYFHPIASKVKKLGKYVGCFSKVAEVYTDKLSSLKPGTVSGPISIDGTAAMMVRHLNLSLDSHEDTRHFIRHLLPDAKFVVMMRNPITRTYSDYRWRVRNKETTQNREQIFHDQIERIAKRYHACVATTNNSPRSVRRRQCVYDMERNMPLGPQNTRFYPSISFYAVHIAEWLELFPRHNFHFIRTEDYTRDILGTLRGVATFLGIDSSSGVLSSLVDETRAKQLPPSAMLNATRVILREMYRPANQQLATLLGDTRYLLWNNDM